MCFSFTPYYFAIIHIKYCIEMSPLVPHAFLGMPYILLSYIRYVYWAYGLDTQMEDKERKIDTFTFLGQKVKGQGHADMFNLYLVVTQ